MGIEISEVISNEQATPSVWVMQIKTPPSLKIFKAGQFGNFYLCPNACVRVGFEKAVDLEYRCPECGSILNHQDNTKTIDFLKTKIKELQMNGSAKGKA